jgi:rhodanese-related sulfurtransferase
MKWVYPGFPAASAGSDQHMPETIEPKDAREPVASRELIVLDIRAAGEWEGGSIRIPGSVHIPADQLSDRLDELPEDKRILVVSPNGEGTAEAAEQLDGQGRETVVLDGGVEAWRSDSLLTQPSPDAAPPKGENEPPHEEPGDEDAQEAGDDASDESDDVEDAEGGDQRAEEAETER